MLISYLKVFIIIKKTKLHCSLSKRHLIYKHLTKELFLAFINLKLKLMYKEKLLRLIRYYHS